jgi:hypothetical protein
VVLEDTAAALAKKADKLAKSRAKLSEPLPTDAGTREVIGAHILMHMYPCILIKSSFCFFF